MLTDCRFGAAEDMDLDNAPDHPHIGLAAVASMEGPQEGSKRFLDQRDPTWRGR